MCSICDSADRVRRAADALVKVCLATAGIRFSGSDAASAQLRDAFPIDPAPPPDFGQLLNRIDRADRN